MRSDASADPYRRAVDYWQSQGVPLLPAATTEAIAAVFARLHRPLSTDVQRLYTAAGGFVDYESERWWCFWSLDRLVQHNEGRDSDYL